VGFTPAVSDEAKKAMRTATRQRNWRNRTELSLNEIARLFNPVLQGWLNYYGRYCCSGLNTVWRHFNQTLVSWIMSKYKSLKGHKRKAARFLGEIMKRDPKLFAHWQKGIF
jgi:RNA-directed DNA polymerase